jgi:hypothetical protein
LLLAIVGVDVLALLPAEEPARAAGVQITVSDKVLNEIDPPLAAIRHDDGRVTLDPDPWPA